MYCLRWWIPLFLLPFPRASPFFLVLFLLSFALHTKPCVYCALIITGLFTTSSNWYPTLEPHASPTLTTTISPTLHNLPPSIAPSSDSPFSSGSTAKQLRTSKSWLDFGHNGGNGFWSPLVRIPPLPATTTPIASSSATTRDETPSDPAATVQLPTILVKALKRLGYASIDRVTIPRRVFVGLGKAGGLGVWVNLLPGGGQNPTSMTHSAGEVSVAS